VDDHVTDFKKETRLGETKGTQAGMTQCQKQSYTTLLTTVMLHVKLSLLYIYVFSVMLIKGLLIHIEHLNAWPPPTWFFPNFLICGP